MKTHEHIFTDSKGKERIYRHKHINGYPDGFGHVHIRPDSQANQVCPHVLKSIKTRKK